MNEIISKGIQSSDQLDNLFDVSLRRFGYVNNARALYVIQKLREDLHLFQNPSLALATINSYEMIQPSAQRHETIAALSSHASIFTAQSHMQVRMPLVADRASLKTASGQVLVRASSASRAAQVLAQRFHLQ